MTFVPRVFKTNREVTIIKNKLFASFFKLKVLFQENSHKDEKRSHETILYLTELYIAKNSTYERIQVACFLVCDLASKGKNVGP